MRDLLIKCIYDLSDETGEEIIDNLRSWSNIELLELYGNLRIEEYYQAMEKLNESERET